MPILHIGLELLKVTGGTAQGVADFQNALEGSKVIALCDRRKRTHCGPFKNDWIYLDTAEFPIASGYSYISKSTRATVKDLSASCPLVFSHMLYRYNSNWSEHIARHNGIPYCVVPHGSLDPWVFTYRGWQKRPWLKFYGKRYLENASAIIFATAGEMKKASEVISVRNGRVIHWPVDIPDRAKLKVTREEVRVSLGVGASDRILLYFGRVHSCKRPLFTIRAFAKSCAPKVHLVMVGPAQDVTKEQCVQAAGDSIGRFHWVGPVYGEDKWKYLASADGYITLSEKENFNYCLGESLGAGLPVIVSPGNDLASELESVNCGWMLKDNSEASAINAIQAFAATSDSQISEFGQNGRRFAVDELSRSVFNAKLRDLAELLIRNNK